MARIGLLLGCRRTINEVESKFNGPRNPKGPSTSAINTGTDHLLAIISYGGHLTLNRPERRNALSQEMVEGPGRAIPILDDDPGSLPRVLSPCTGNRFGTGYKVTSSAGGMTRTVTVTPAGTFVAFGETACLLEDTPVRPLGR